jgi:hypothetical protein
MECPQKKFESLEEYKLVLKDMYNTIETQVQQWLNNEMHMVFWDYDTIWTDGVHGTLEECLTELTGSNEWSIKTSKEITLSISGMLIGLTETLGLYKKGGVSPKSLTQIVMTMIKWELSEEGNADCRLAEFPQE